MDVVDHGVGDAKSRGRQHHAFSGGVHDDARRQGCGFLVTDGAEDVGCIDAHGGAVQRAVLEVGEGFGGRLDGQTHKLTAGGKVAFLFSRGHFVSPRKRTCAAIALRTEGAGFVFEFDLASNFLGKGFGDHLDIYRGASGPNGRTEPYAAAARRLTKSPIVATFDGSGTTPSMAWR